MTGVLAAGGATDPADPAAARLRRELRGALGADPAGALIGQHYTASHSMPEIAQPHLVALAEKTGESASLATLDGDEVVYIARVATRRIMSINVSPGTRVPAHATSMGRVLLAWAAHQRRSSATSPHRLAPAPRTPSPTPNSSARDARPGAPPRLGAGLRGARRRPHLGLRPGARPHRHRGRRPGLLDSSTGRSTPGHLESRSCPSPWPPHRPSAPTSATAAQPTSAPAPRPARDGFY